MTHGRGAWQKTEGEDDEEIEEGKEGGEVVQEGLVDVASTSRFLSFFEWGAYGWKGAMQIARSGDELGGDAAPDNNADTIALLGSGMFVTPSTSS
jgi:hypothetical protein